MLKSQEQQLDRLFQIINLRKNPNSIISNKKADCSHHFVQSRSYSIRWYLEAGVSVTQEEHNIFHSSDPREDKYKAIVILKKGEKWFSELQKRKFQPAKYITYENVKKYLNGTIKDYIQ